MPECRQFEIGISTRRYLPAIGTAGFERVVVNGASRLPWPPPRTMHITLEVIWWVVSFQKGIYMRRLIGPTKKRGSSSLCARFAGVWYYYKAGWHDSRP